MIGRKPRQMIGRKAWIVLAVLLLVWAAPQLYAEWQYVWITWLAPLGEGAGRFSTLEALGSPGQRVLLRLLAEGNSAHRSFAARSLARSESPSDEVIDALMRAAVEDPHLAVRYDAVAALATIGSPRAQPLLERLSSAGDMVAQRGLYAMGGPARAMVEECARSCDEIARWSALSVLCESAAGEWAPAVAASVRQALEDGGVQTRVTAVKCLSGGPESEVLPILEALLDDDSISVRVEAAIELGGAGRGAAVLLQVLSDEGAPPLDRVRAARALGELGVCEARASLDEATRDRDGRVQQAAQSGLFFLEDDCGAGPDTDRGLQYVTESSNGRK